MDKRVFVAHSSKIFYDMSITFMVIGYLMCFIFSFDLLGTFAMLTLALFLVLLLIILAVLGSILIFPIASAGYRQMLGDMGKFIIGIFDSDMGDKVVAVLQTFSRYYPYIAAFIGVVVIAGIVLNILNKSSRGKIIVLSVMGTIYIASIILSAIFISGLGAVKI